MRIARGLSAMCLLVTFVVVAYDVLVIRPFSDQNLVPTARYLGMNGIDLIQTWNVAVVSVLTQMPGN